MGKAKQTDEKSRFKVIPCHGTYLPLSPAFVFRTASFSNLTERPHITTLDFMQGRTKKLFGKFLDAATSKRYDSSKTVSKGG